MFLKVFSSIGAAAAFVSVTGMAGVVAIIQKSDMAANFSARQRRRRPTWSKSTALPPLRLTPLPPASPTSSFLALLLLHEVPARVGADGVAGHRAELHDAQATPREAHQPPGRSNESIAPPLPLCEAEEMLHAFKRRKCYTPLKKRLLPARYREKPAEIWIACNPVALTNRDPHGFDLPSRSRARGVVVLPHIACIRAFHSA